MNDSRETAGAGSGGVEVSSPLRPEVDAPKKLTLRFKLTMATLMIVVSFVSSEIVLRMAAREVVLRRRMADGGLYEPFDPGGVGDHVTPEFRVRYQINAFGYRDRADRQESIDPKRRRLALFGDSFSVGWGIPQDQTFAALIEARLSGSIELWNTARSGNTPLYTIESARYFSERFKPAALIVQLFDNDVIEARRDEARFDWDSEGRMIEPKERFRRETGLMTWASREFNNLALRKAARKLGELAKGEAFTHFVRAGASFKTEPPVASDLQAMLRGENEGFNVSSGFYFEEARAAWREDLQRIRRILLQISAEARARGQELGFLYIPHAVVFAEGERAARWRAENPLRAIVREVAAAEKRAFCDFTERLEKEPRPLDYYFSGDLHLNPKGHALLAEDLLSSPVGALIRGR